MSTSPDTTQTTLFGDESVPATDATFDVSLPPIADHVDPAESTGCSHITSLFTDPHAADGLLNKYKTVVAWHTRRVQDTSPPAKRRKVRRVSHVLHTRALLTYRRPTRSLRPPVMSATRRCPDRLLVWPAPLQDAGPADTLSTISTNPDTLFVCPSRRRSSCLGANMHPPLRIQALIPGPAPFFAPSATISYAILS